MKALIPFDSTPASLQNLQVACRDLLAKRGADQTSPRILVVLFEGLEMEQPLEQELSQSEQLSEELLEQAMLVAQQLGLEQVEGQILRCYREEETEALVELAHDWQAGAIYLPQVEKALVYSTKAGSRFWRWLGRSPKNQQLPVQDSSLVKLQLDKGKLLKLGGCPLVITGSHQVVMRLSCVYPASKPQTPAIAWNVRAATLDWPEYKPGLSRVGSSKMLNTSTSFRQN